LPIIATILYRPASIAPGAHRLPSTVREEDCGVAALAMVRVATRTSPPTAHPQDEQKRLLSTISSPHVAHFAMNVPIVACRWRRFLPSMPTQETQQLPSPDGFLIDSGDPLRNAHEQVNFWLVEMEQGESSGQYAFPFLEPKRLKKHFRAAQLVELLEATMARILWNTREHGKSAASGSQAAA
jgi:hypothetical protein